MKNNLNPTHDDPIKAAKTNNKNEAVAVKNAVMMRHFFTVTDASFIQFSPSRIDVPKTILANCKWHNNNLPSRKTQWQSSGAFRRQPHKRNGPTLSDQPVFYFSI
jgi:hypothetical protein